MPSLSVIIPSRNEPWLLMTIESIRASICSDTEIIAVIDGEESEPKVPDPWPADGGPPVRIIRNASPIGQRQSINLAVRESRAQFIVKTDAHSMFAEGFDAALMADCGSQDTIIPQMWNLHSHDMVCIHCGERYYNRPPMDRCEKCGSEKIGKTPVMLREVQWHRNKHKAPTDWMWFRSPTDPEMPLRVQYWDAPTARAFPAEYAAHRAWAKRQGDIAEVMTGQGACWMMMRDRYWQLGGMDEAHGHWGQMGVEVACKSWLSGGRQLVNRKTWFAHLFRCGGSEGCPWEMSGRQQDEARKYSIDLWSKNKWSGQTRPLSWLIEHFWPVPTWDKPETSPELRDTNDFNLDMTTIVTPDAAVYVSPQAARTPTSPTGLPNTPPKDSAANDDPMVSVLIPARNELYLEATIKDLLKNLRLTFEILVGLDGPDQKNPTINDPRVRVIVAEDRIGMRPMINKLARAARGKYLLRMDAHCMVAEGIDKALVGVCEREGHVTVVAKRYELDAKRWKRRERTDTPCRRLTHESEDGCGLRSLPWPEYDQAHKGEEISETMTCSGSSWTCLRSTFVDVWGGFDERHGTFGQEGCEIACMTWLSGGRFLVHKGTWYAHWNRNKSTYTLGAHVKEQSINHSKWLWMGNHWPHAKYSFQWLVDKFNPPGWPKSEVMPPEASGGFLPAIHQGALVKGWKCRVGKLWDHRLAISDPGKLRRLEIFWSSFESLIRGNAPGEKGTEAYRAYLISHISRQPVLSPTPHELRKVEKTMASGTALAADIAQHGLKSPLEFYAQDGRLILWKGYRRLVIMHALGRDDVVVPCRVFKDRTAAGVLSPQTNLTRLEPPVAGDLHKLAEEQFMQLGRNASDKYWVHGYTRYYDTHLPLIRKRAKRVMELGLLNGASLALWRQYFPRAELFGVDINPEKWKRFAGKLKRTKVFVGDESDMRFMQGIADHGPFDLIVDDASHDPKLQQQAFEALWPSVRQYGFYVIEDIYRSFQAGSEACCISPGLEESIYEQRDVLQIHHYYNIVFIQKA